MGLLKYKDIIGMAKDAVKQVMVPIRVKEMKKKAELEITKLEGKIFELEQNIQAMASEYPLDFDKLINYIDEMQLVTRRKSQFEKIIEEMFSE